jgi:hypothetical protein
VEFDVLFFAHTYEVTDDGRHQLTARSIGIDGGVVTKRVVKNDQLCGVALADGRRVGRTAVFVRPGNVPAGTEAAILDGGARPFQNP